MDYHTMKRKQLQALCKKNKIPANLTNMEMANRLTSLLKENEKPKARGRSCLKSSAEIVVIEDSDVENKPPKKVKFSPENELFEYSKSDPRKQRRMGRRIPRSRAVDEIKDLAVKNVDGFVSDEEIANNPVRVTRCRTQSSVDDGLVSTMIPPVEKKRGRKQKEEISGSVDILESDKEIVNSPVRVTRRRTQSSIDDGLVSTVNPPDEKKTGRKSRKEIIESDEVKLPTRRLLRNREVVQKEVVSNQNHVTLRGRKKGIDKREEPQSLIVLLSNNSDCEEKDLAGTSKRSGGKRPTRLKKGMKNANVSSIISTEAEIEVKEPMRRTFRSNNRRKTVISQVADEEKVEKLKADVMDNSVVNSNLESLILENSVGVEGKLNEKSVQDYATKEVKDDSAPQTTGIKCCSDSLAERETVKDMNCCNDLFDELDSTVKLKGTETEKEQSIDTCKNQAPVVPKGQALVEIEKLDGHNGPVIDECVTMNHSQVCNISGESNNDNKIFVNMEEKLVERAENDKGVEAKNNESILVDDVKDCPDTEQASLEENTVSEDQEANATRKYVEISLVQEFLECDTNSRLCSEEIIEKAEITIEKDNEAFESKKSESVIDDIEDFVDLGKLECDTSSRICSEEIIEEDAMTIEKDDECVELNNPHATPVNNSHSNDEKTSSQEMSMSVNVCEKLVEEESFNKQDSQETVGPKESQNENSIHILTTGKEYIDEGSNGKYQVNKSNPCEADVKNDEEVKYEKAEVLVQQELSSCNETQLNVDVEQVFGNIEKDLVKDDESFESKNSENVIDGIEDSVGLGKSTFAVGDAFELKNGEREIDGIEDSVDLANVERNSSDVLEISNEGDSRREGYASVAIMENDSEMELYIQSMPKTSEDRGAGRDENLNALVAATQSSISVYASISSEVYSHLKSRDETEQSELDIIESSEIEKTSSQEISMSMRCEKMVEEASFNKQDSQEMVGVMKTQNDNSKDNIDGSFTGNDQEFQLNLLFGSPVIGSNQCEEGKEDRSDEKSTDVAMSLNKENVGLKELEHGKSIHKQNERFLHVTGEHDIDLAKIETKFFASANGEKSSKWISQEGQNRRYSTEAAAAEEHAEKSHVAMEEFVVFEREDCVSVDVGISSDLQSSLKSICVTEQVKKCNEGESEEMIGEDESEHKEKLATRAAEEETIVDGCTNIKHDEQHMFAKQVNIHERSSDEQNNDGSSNERWHEEELKILFATPVCEQKTVREVGNVSFGKWDTTQDMMSVGGTFNWESNDSWHDEPLNNIFATPINGSFCHYKEEVVDGETEASDTVISNEIEEKMSEELVENNKEDIVEGSLFEEGIIYDQDSVKVCNEDTKNFSVEGNIEASLTNSELGFCKPHLNEDLAKFERTTQQDDEVEISKKSFVEGFDNQLEHDVSVHAQGEIMSEVLGDKFQQEKEEEQEPHEHNGRLVIDEEEDLSEVHGNNFNKFQGDIGKNARCTELPVYDNEISIILDGTTEAAQGTPENSNEFNVQFDVFSGSEVNLFAERGEVDGFDKSNVKESSEAISNQSNSNDGLAVEDEQLNTMFDTPKDSSFCHDKEETYLREHETVNRETEDSDEVKSDEIEEKMKKSCDLQQADELEVSKKLPVGVSLFVVESCDLQERSYDSNQLQVSPQVFSNLLENDKVVKTESFSQTTVPCCDNLRVHSYGEMISEVREDKFNEFQEDKEEEQEPHEYNGGLDVDEKEETPAVLDNNFNELMGVIGNNAEEVRSPNAKKYYSTTMKVKTKKTNLTNGTPNKLLADMKENAPSVKREPRTENITEAKALTKRRALGQL